MILHTLSALPQSQAFTDCLTSAGTEDAILLLGNGVYCALGENHTVQQLRDTGAKLFMLGEHARQAGVSPPADAVTMIDMGEFVELTERFTRQVAWY